MKIRLALTAALAAAFAAESYAADKAAPANPAPAAPAAPAPAAAAPAFELKDPVAVVDGTEIKVEELERAVNSMLGQQGHTIQEVPAEVKPRLFRQVLDGVIVEKLVTRESAKVEVTDADVKAEFDKFKGQFPNEEEMKKQLAAAGQSMEKIQGEIHQYLQQNRWIAEQVKGKTEVTDAEAQDFYKANPDQFKQPDEVRASHILVQCEKDAKEDVVKDKREAANKILDRVKKGEDFGKLATELSEDPSAKENHGDLNFFSQEKMVPEFSKAAFAMKKGDVSDAPVRSEFGFHIIKVTDRKEAATVAFDEAKVKLVAYLTEQKRRSETGKVLQGLREKAKVTVNMPNAE